MSLSKLAKNASLPLAAGLYSGFSAEGEDVSFTGAFLRGSILAGAGLSLAKAGDPRFAKRLSKMKGHSGIASRAAYSPAFLANETMHWIGKNAFDPARSFAKKVGTGDFKSITGKEGAGAAFTAYSAYEAAGILKSAGEGDIEGVTHGAMVFAGGKYAYMGGIYASKAWKHKKVIEAGLKAYSHADESGKALMRTTVIKTMQATTKKGVGTGSDWIMKGTIKTNAQLKKELQGVGAELLSDPSLMSAALHTQSQMGAKEKEKIINAASRMFNSTYRGSMY